ncbi:MAG: C40 family peptidase [Bacteroidales bacterium]|nr:C40 family peptidase [Bacteroidales bacterium]
MARDLDDEDFVIGQLYADERYDETPVIAEPVEAKPQRQPDGSDCNNALGLKCNSSDNELLYKTVNSWLGVPYRYGGTDRNGIDCSAFVGVVFRQVYGKNLHRTANDMLQDVSLIQKNQLKEGDLLFFTNSKGKVSHVGIYLKDGLFAHSSTSAGVCVSRLADSYWSKHFYRGGRVK